MGFIRPANPLGDNFGDKDLASTAVSTSTLIKLEMFGKDEVDFILFFNSRNIRRKQIPDTMWAFKMFLDSLPKEEAKELQKKANILREELRESEFIEASHEIRKELV